MAQVQTPNQVRNRNAIATVGTVCVVGGLAGMFAFGSNLGSFYTLLSATLVMASIAFIIAASFMWLSKLMPDWYRESTEDQARTPAYKNYMKTMWKCMAIYVVLLSAFSAAVQTQLHPAVQAIASIAPVLPLAWLMAAHVRFVRGLDELQRKIEMESVAISALITSLICMMFGFLVAGNVLHVNAGLALLLVFPVLCVTYGIGKIFVIRHYS